MKIIYNQFQIKSVDVCCSQMSKHLFEHENISIDAYDKSYRILFRQDEICHCPWCGEMIYVLTAEFVTATEVLGILKEE